METVISSGFALAKGEAAGGEGDGRRNRVANDGSFASPVLHGDQSSLHTFNGAVKVTYHDAFAKAHTGTVTVNGSPVAVKFSASSTTVVYGSG